MLHLINKTDVGDGKKNEEKGDDHSDQWMEKFSADGIFHLTDGCVFQKKCDYIVVQLLKKRLFKKI